MTSVTAKVVETVDPTTGLDLFVNEARNHVAWGEILQGRRIAGSKCLTCAVAEDATFTAGGFR